MEEGRRDDGEERGEEFRGKVKASVRVREITRIHAHLRAKSCTSRRTFG